MSITKDKIIEAAFSFYKNPSYVDFSLNQIAEKVGISKPAIYRHFKNKEDLLNAMKTRFFDLLSKRLIEVQIAFENGKEASKIPFADTIKFFVKTPAYINYFINQFSYNKNFEEECKEQISLRIKNPNPKLFKAFNDDLNSQIHSVYGGSSLFFFIKTREYYFLSENIKANEINNEDFSIKMINFLEKGLQGFFDDDDLLAPKEISEKRKKELNKICEINKEEFPEENKIFTALASVIRKYGFQNVTLECIADELSMAKSSLYFYFDNKNQMIFTLIEQELSLLSEITKENSIEAKNYSEFVYILLNSEMNYFLMRPSILPILGWLLQNSDNKVYKNKVEINYIWERKMYELSQIEKINLGFPLLPEHLTFWYGTLPVALMIYGRKHNLSKTDFYHALDKMFDFIQFGIN